MKRLFLMLICTAVLSLTTFTACATSPTQKCELPRMFTSQVEITASETVYDAILSRFADGVWQIELTSPAAVKGLIFSIKEGDTEVSFDGLRFTFDTSRFPVGSVVSVVVDALDRIIPTPLEMIVGDEQNLASGEIGELSYTLTLSKTKIPLRLELPDSGMTVEFLDYKVIEIEE